MDIDAYIGNSRITDYSFAVAKHIAENICNKSSLDKLYNYHLSLCEGPDALYPMSNWQPHRLCLMSSIAVRLNDPIKIKKCEELSIDWIRVSDCKCCTVKSQDYHYRDSCQYVVYGWWALVQSFVYLQKITKKPYRPYFTNYLKWIQTFIDGKVTHVEFINSKNMPADRSKPFYGKTFDPTYNKNFSRVYDQLIS